MKSLFSLISSVWLVSLSLVAQTSVPVIDNIGTVLPAACTVGQRFFKTNATAGQNIYACTSANIWTQQGGSATVPRVFGATFVSTDGVSALTAGATTYFVFPFACNIVAWNVSVNAGTATIDIWKIASGTAIPTVANTITGANTPEISSGTSVHSTNVSGWSTTAVSANDIFGINLKTVATATTATLTVECN